MSKILRILDWDTRDVLAEKVRTPETANFPLAVDWEGVFKEVKPKDGYHWSLLYDSCDEPTDTPKPEGEDEVYVGYAKAVDLREYWTQHDNTGLHIDGIREGNGVNGIPTGWKIYDPYLDEKRRKAQEYADALANSPFFYYMKDTGSCQKPTQERVYRIFVDPKDPTKISSDYWGNLGSTPDKIYTSIYLVDITDKEHIAKMTMQNGKIVIEEQPFYLSSMDMQNCFDPILWVPLGADDTDSEMLALTNNGLLDAFKKMYNISEIQALRRGPPSKRKYLTVDQIKEGFKDVVGLEMDPDNFTFEKLSDAYKKIIDCVANTINNAQYSNPKTSGARYVSVSDFRSVFSRIVDGKLNLDDFTLEEVCYKLNEIVKALNNLIEGAS